MIAGLNLLIPKTLYARKTDVRIAIVGAGMAGMSAAHYLMEAGWRPMVYEAAHRLGGRIYSVGGIAGSETVVELGGEFINSTHQDMLTLAKFYRLPLLDRATVEEQSLREAYFFGGQSRTTAEVVAALRPFMARIAADHEILNSPKAGDRLSLLDRLSLKDYLDKIGMSGWPRALIENMMIPEYGLEPEQQSCLNLLWLAPSIAGEELQLLGESDERYSIIGGNQRLIMAIAERLGDRIATGRVLEAILPAGSGLELHFTDHRVKVDLAIVTIPYTSLRQVEMRVPLATGLQRSIAELAYGTNAKMMLGFERRYWRQLGYNGATYTDLGYQSSWDNSQGQSTETGGITFFLGGKAGEQRSADVSMVASDYLKQFDQVLPGARLSHNSKFAYFSWKYYPFIMGSYACFQPGQYSSFIAENLYREKNPLGQVGAGALILAGEHTSDDFQGFMNGAAQSGRLAAKVAIRRLGSFSRQYSASFAPALAPTRQRGSKSKRASVS